MLRRFAFVLLSCMALAIPASAQNTAPEKSVVKLGIGSRIQIPYLAVNIAEHKGYFKEQGLTVEFNDFGGGGSDSLKALVSGSVDFIAGAYEHTLYLQGRGQTITSVALQNNSFGVVIALSKERAAAYKSPKDLVGLKIGVTAPGSSSALALSLLLSKDNLGTDQVSIVGVGAGNSALA
ncbi:MAG: ABC transporter substrate-binding protein, partial [Pseudolabrys sp.]